jgi:hypothetical protein
MLIDGFSLDLTNSFDGNISVARTLKFLESGRLYNIDRLCREHVQVCVLPLKEEKKTP